MIKSLHAQNHPLASEKTQLDFLNQKLFDKGGFDTFQKHLQKGNYWPLKPTGTEIFQINLGYMCNQTCKHCHVDAGPDRKEIMTKKVMQQCLEAISFANISTLDVTGGAPEMNPNFRWFISEAKRIGVKEIIVRSNLTIILANPKYYDLPDFFKENGVRVVSSLPYYKKVKTDRQRGNGVFDKSIDALLRLNAIGYGLPNSSLLLDLVYNPSGAFLPSNQSELEQDFKKALKADFNIEFTNLFAITNLPISRFLDYLIASENYEDYMEKLITSYNPMAVEAVMCRNTISVDWEGFLYDCDFNQMLKIKLPKGTGQHVSEFDISKIDKRNIEVNQHCFGCTAGAGSSCQGTVA